MNFAKQELSLRNGKTMQEVWIAYKEFIYDVTDSELFENGEHYSHTTGIDLTDEMESATQLDDVLKEFNIIGKLIL